MAIIFAFTEVNEHTTYILYLDVYQYTSAHGAVCGHTKCLPKASIKTL